MTVEARGAYLNEPSSDEDQPRYGQEFFPTMAGISDDDEDRSGRVYGEYSRIL